MLGLGTSILSSDISATAVQKNLGPADLFLNTYSGASAAYSFRKLDNSYSGNCIRVVNDSGVSLDIGFDGSGYLDTSAIATHCGSGNGKISIWYDQSGNSRIALALSAANQPLIFSSGSMVEVNNKAAALFDGGDRMVTTAFQAHTGSFYAMCVVQTPSSIGNENIFSQDDAQGTPQVRTAQYLRTASSTSSGRVVVFNTSGSNFADPSHRLAPLLKSCCLLTPRAEGSSRALTILLQTELPLILEPWPQTAKLLPLGLTQVLLVLGLSLTDISKRLLFGMEIKARQPGPILRGM